MQYSDEDVEPKTNSRHYSAEVKAEALRLLTEEQLSARQVGLRLGVSHRQISHWASLAGMTLKQHGGGGIDELPDQAPDRSRGHGNRLSAMDRAVIFCRHNDGTSHRAIARELGVHHTTVMREIKRGHHPHDGRYDPGWAHRRTAEKRARSTPGKLEDPWLRRCVVDGLNQAWSPQQIAQRLRLHYPDRHDRQVSHETIYQALYVQGKGTLREELKREKALRSGRVQRIPRSHLPPKAGRSWLQDAHISTRPAAAQDRAVPGHIEGDLVIGRGGHSALITLIARCTRYALIRRLPERHDAPTVATTLIDMVADLPQHLRQTLTWDQGGEMAACADFTLATDCQVFFCDPHSPWQRPTNENLNGLVRDFYPKGTNFRDITDTQIAEMQDLLNGRPRRVLQWHTPTEKMAELLTGGALTP